MSDGDLIRARPNADGTVERILPDGSTEPLTGQTDWARLAAMTAEEIEANSLADPDNPPPTEEELARMQPVPNPRLIRQRLHLTQEQLANRFDIPLSMRRDWEQGARKPDTAARTLLRLIKANPEVVQRGRVLAR